MGRISPERRDSNTVLRAWCAPITGDVLSIGSGGDIDKEGRTYRDYFSRARSYVTSDVIPGCDRQLDARDMPAVADASFDAVFASGVLEHIDDCHAAVREVWRVLRPDGLFVVGVPFKQPIHRAPMDFWRFTEYGLRALLGAFAVETVTSIGDPVFPFAYWAKARKVGRHG